MYASFYYIVGLFFNKTAFRKQFCEFFIRKSMDETFLYIWIKISKYLILK